MLEKNGLVKLVEECGELIQIAAKKMTRMDSDEHWDGKGSLQSRLEEEIADVEAILCIVKHEFKLNRDLMRTRTLDKIVLFNEWLMEKEGTPLND